MISLTLTGTIIRLVERCTQSITYHIRPLRHRVHDSKASVPVNSKRRYASRGGLTYSRLSARVCVNACAVGLVKYVNISGPSHAGRYPRLREIDESHDNTLYIYIKRAHAIRVKG